MLGMLFTEAVDFIEDQVGPVALEEILEKAELRGDAAYTALGNYPHEDLIRIIEATAAVTRLPAEALMRAFGSHVFAILVEGHAHARSLAEKGMRPFLFGVQQEIHDALAPLYEAAAPPVVLAEEENGTLVIRYHSHRPFAAVAHGLLEGCCAYFGEGYEVRAHPEVGSDGHAASFEVAMPESGGK